jgi:hypothetical protein
MCFLFVKVKKRLFFFKGTGGQARRWGTGSNNMLTENANTFSLSLQYNNHQGQYSSQPTPSERVSQHGIGPDQEGTMSQDDTGGLALPARVSQPGTYSSAAEKMMMKMGYKLGKFFVVGCFLFVISY